MLVMPNLQRPRGLRVGTITAIVQGIATVTLDGGGTVPFHPSAYRSSHVDGPRVGERVEVSGGAANVQAEAVWRV
jgi:hypothetical protein